MIFPDGRSRVVISNISPAINNNYKVKVTLTEKVKISADIFCDGHDILRASVFFSDSTSKWKEIKMQFIGNDKWECNVIPAHLGIHKFKIRAWVDHFSSWKSNLLKKYHSAQNIDLEIKIGNIILNEASAQLKKTKRTILEKAAKRLDTEIPFDELLLILNDEKLSEVFNEKYNSDWITESRQFEFFVEPEKAKFSSWYELFPRSASPDKDRSGNFSI